MKLFLLTFALIFTATAMRTKNSLKLSKKTMATVGLLTVLTIESPPAIVHAQEDCFTDCYKNCIQV